MKRNAPIFLLETNVSFQLLSSGYQELVILKLKQIAENNDAINMKQYLKKLNIGKKEAKAETESFIKKHGNTKK